MRQIVLDTETTGLNPRSGDRIIEIGCVELVNRRLQQIQHVVDIYDEQGLDAARAAINQSAFRTTSAIREQVRTMVEEEHERLVDRAASSRRSADLLLGLAFAGIPFGLAVVASVYGILLSELRRRSRAEKRAASATQQLAGNLEQIESLEQLRVLEAGFRIAVGLSPAPFPPGIDTPEDLHRAEVQVRAAL